MVVTAAAVTVLVWPDRRAAGPSAGPGAAPSASAQGPPATNITAAQLRPILLTADQIPSGTTAGPLVLERDSATLSDDSATLDNPQCVGAWAPAQQSAYAASGYTGVAAQFLRALNEPESQDSVSQAVIAFPEDKAGASLVTQRGQWGLCGGKTVTVTQPGTPGQVWEFAQPVTTSGVIVLAATLRGGNASCQHGMQVRGNVIIDIRQCRAAGAADVAGLVTATAAKVPRQ